MDNKKKINWISILGIILTVVGALPAGLIIGLLILYTMFMILLSSFTSSWIGSFRFEDYIEGYSELFVEIAPYFWVIVLGIVVMIIGLSLIKKKDKN